MFKLGRYEISEQLGAGSMGVVYRARDAMLDRDVAVKTIRTGAEVEPEIRERFYREARACARLDHPNIVTVYELGEIDGTAYFAMELLKGCDFRRIIQERRDMPIEVKLELMIQVCEALDHAHRLGIVHRDIKPSNLFACSNSRAKVLDFGLARLPSSHLTMAGRIMGTPHYMAPEQIRGQASDARADLFSATVVLFELLVYAHPFRSAVIPRRIVEEEPDSIFDHGVDVPPLLGTIFGRGLAKKPSDRYATGHDLAADLRKVLEHNVTTFSPSNSVDHDGKDREATTASTVSLTASTAEAGYDHSTGRKKKGTQHVVDPHDGRARS
jgi:eukaryotic-like serine/threonine-protein kinase